jgi:hypothetical protein
MSIYQNISGPLLVLVMSYFVKRRVFSFNFLNKNVNFDIKMYVICVRVTYIFNINLKLRSVTLQQFVHEKFIFSLEAKIYF